MCGIIGIAQKESKNSGRVIYDGLVKLEYRGYDSVGMAIINEDNTIKLLKDKGGAKEVGKALKFEEYHGKVAIGHSRWATHGPPSKINAHPHLSSNGKFAVIHNGIIENYMEIKKELIKKGFKFISQTDTEVIPNLLESYVDEGCTTLQAIKKLIQIIEGTYAIVLISLLENDKIFAFKKDNPLVVGIGQGKNYCASDIPAFLNYTNRVVVIKDDELVILMADGIQILETKNWTTVNPEIRKISWNVEAAQKGGYPHFMIKEIHEQPAVVKAQLGTQEDKLEKAVELINGAEKIVVTGAGSAYIAGLVAYYTISKFTGKAVLPCIASEWASINPILKENDLVIGVSQSGETLDTIKALKKAKESKAKIITIVNTVDSSITRIANLILYTHAGPEICVAATKTYLTIDLFIWRIAFACAKNNNKLIPKEREEFMYSFSVIDKIIGDLVQKYEAYAKEVSEKLKDKTSIYYLGKGISYLTAEEGALKIKEIAYIHAEAYPAGESKHGPIAMIEKGFPVIFVAPNDTTRRKMTGSIQEMKARGAMTIGIIEEGDEELIQLFDYYFEINPAVSNYLSTLAYQIPLQLIAYYTSILKGNNPDRPRNLAKSVTVE